jgi:uncharacterized protein YkwD
MTCSAFIAGVLSSLGLSGCQTTPQPNTQPAMYRSLASHSAQVDQEAARAMISAYRMNKGLKPLIFDPSLQVTAQHEADGMARENKTRSAELLKKTLLASGVKDAGANLSAGYHTLAEAFSGWRDSPEHNRIMLSPHATRMGIATSYTNNSKYGVFWALVVSQ